jgi:hypothetical protein
MPQGGDRRRAELHKYAQRLAMPARWSRAPQARRTTLPVPAREAGRGSTRGSEHAEDRNDRPQGGNLPLAAAGRWLAPRASVLAHGGREVWRQSRESNGIKSPALVAVGTVRRRGRPPVYAGWISGCGGRMCRDAWRGAKLNFFRRMMAARVVLAGGGTNADCTTRAGTMRRRGAFKDLGRGLRAGLVGTTSSAQRPLGQRGFRGRPIGEWGAAHAVAARGKTFPFRWFVSV